MRTPVSFPPDGAATVGLPVDLTTSRQPWRQAVKSATDFHISNASGTKQRLGRLTGLTVLAEDDQTDFYLHNYQAL